MLYKGDSILKKSWSGFARAELAELARRLRHELSELDDSCDEFPHSNSKFKSVLDGKMHKSFRFSVTRMCVDSAELERFLSKISALPIIANIICCSVVFENGFIEEEKKTQISELNPLTPPENEHHLVDRVQTDVALLQLKDAISRLSPQMSDITHYAFTLPNGVTSPASVYDGRRLISCARSDAATTIIDLWSKTKVDLR